MWTGALLHTCGMFGVKNRHHLGKGMIGILQSFASSPGQSVINFAVTQSKKAKYMFEWL